MKYTLIYFLLLCGIILNAQDKPNILFILADDLGINALNCYGNNIVESPNIDRLYSEGMHFTNGYSNDPTCAPSRAAIMTGQLAPRTNIYRVVDRYLMAKNAEEMRQNMKYLPPASNHLYSKDNGLSPDKLNMAKVFKQHGYRTAAFGKWHLGVGRSGMNSHMGFDEAIETKNHYGFSTVPKQNDYDDLVYNADYCTKKGNEFMKRCVEDDQPFFLYMPYYLVHAPFDPKPAYVTHFKNKLLGTEYDHERVIDVLAMIRSLDDSVGELMQTLKELGVDDNTIVVFTSDNGHYQVKGNNMFAQPYRGNKGDVWEGGIRIPYIFSWPDHIKPGSSCSTPIVHVDLLPTLADLANVQVNPNHPLDGICLSKVLMGKKAPEREMPLVWFYTNYSGFNSKTKQFKSKWVNVIQLNDYKLIEDVETGQYELYSLKEDPLEMNNIYSLDSDNAQQLLDELQKAKEQAGLPLPTPNNEYGK
ncbi:sulfatase [Carboxylicivirga sp. M1479]|uniref:sulfatase n=1 Tax=Carboxylicivirga sp. M1479 TaxID=2594476 RepID=UPI001178AA81|nr:sulfatase [Carboxylicivirga sp. M1479]TRX71775.1 sulfatase [Carboxylicivirga sp. M1479]